jgi:hypothetical protein
LAWTVSPAPKTPTGGTGRADGVRTGKSGYLLYVSQDSIEKAKLLRMIDSNFSVDGRHTLELYAQAITENKREAQNTLAALISRHIPPMQGAEIGASASRTYLHSRCTDCLVCVGEVVEKNGRP